MPFDAFKVSDASEGSKLEAKTESFADTEGQLGGKVSQALEDANRMLANMSREMETDLSGKEMKMAHLIMEQELEKSVPANFKEAYDAAPDWEAAANLVTGNILSKVHRYVNAYLSGGRPKQIAEKVDSASWSGYMSESDVPSVFREVYDAGVTPGDIAVAQAKWTEPGASEERLASVRRKADSGNYMAGGIQAIAGGRVKSVEEQVREASR